MNYHSTNYITSAPLIAEIKQELKSYFEAGAVSELLIPTYIEQCLRRLKGLALKREKAVVFIEDYKGTLPEDFYLLEWAVSYDYENFVTSAIPSTFGTYSKSLTCTGANLSSEFDCGQSCEVFEKITIPTGYAFDNLVMTRPQWIRVYYGSKEFCTDDCQNIKSSSTATMTIQERGKVVTTFRSACVYIQYMSKPLDENGLALIPEILEIEEYIKSHIKFKLFEQLMNSVSDETFNQVKYKFEYYKQDSLNKLQACSVLMLPTKQQTADNKVRLRGRYKKFHIK